MKVVTAIFCSLGLFLPRLSMSTQLDQTIWPSSLMWTPTFAAITDRLVALDVLSVFKAASKMSSKSVTVLDTEVVDVPKSRLENFRSVVQPHMVIPGNTVDALSDPNTDMEFLRLAQLLAGVTPLLNVSESCFNQSLDYVHGLLKASPWAFKVLDAGGKTPSGMWAESVTFCEVMSYVVQKDFCKVQGIAGDFVIPKGNTKSLGAFDSCLETHWPHESFATKYCAVRISGTHNPGSNVVKPAYRLAYMPSWMPSNREDLTIEVLVSLYLDESWPVFGLCLPSSCSEMDVERNFRLLYRKYYAKASPLVCQTREDQERMQKFRIFSYFVVSILLCLTMLVILGTILDLTQDLSKSFKTSGATRKVLVSFSLQSSWFQLTKTSPPSTACLDGLKVISLLLIIFGHLIYAMYSWMLKNPYTGIKWEKGLVTNWFFIISNIYVTVDTFFFVGGFLVAHTAFSALDKTSLRIPVFYFYRYIRLAAPYSAVLLSFMGIAPHLGSGPFWSEIAMKMGDNCQENWWANLLFVNNFLGRRDRECMGVTWYLACDMQVLAHADAPLGWIGTWILVFTIVPAVLAFRHHLPLVQTMFHIPEQDFNFTADFYVQTHVRFQPYLVGIATAFVFWKSHHKLETTKTATCVGWIGAIFTLITISYYPWPLRQSGTVANPAYGRWNSAGYHGLSRLLWGMALAWVTLACGSGRGGLVNDFLSWTRFAPLSRLTYLTYLVHYNITSMFFFSKRDVAEMTPSSLIVHFIVLCVASFSLALALFFLVEGPVQTLQRPVMKALLKQKEN